MVIRDIKEIKDGFVQKFYYTPLPFGSVSHNRILELIQANALNKEDVAVMKYLYHFKCAPVSYIIKDVLPEKDATTLRRRLLDLVKQRILNAFILTNTEDQEFTSSGSEIFFTVDYCAIAILKSGLNDENLDNWKGSDLFMTGVKVKKCLEIIDFYRLVSQHVDYFTVGSLYKAYNSVVRTKATIKMNNTIFLTEVVDADDVYEATDSKMLEKILRYEQILGTEGWSNYFPDSDNPPILLILADTLKSADVYCKRIGETRIPNIRYFVLDEKAWYKEQGGNLVKTGK